MVKRCTSFVLFFSAFCFGLLAVSSASAGNNNDDYGDHGFHLFGGGFNFNFTPPPPPPRCTANTAYCRNYNCVTLRDTSACLASCTLDGNMSGCQSYCFSSDAASDWCLADCRRANKPANYPYMYCHAEGIDRHDCKQKNVDWWGRYMTRDDCLAAAN